MDKGSLFAIVLASVASGALLDRFMRNNFAPKPVEAQTLTQINSSQGTYPVCSSDAVQYQVLEEMIGGGGDGTNIQGGYIAELEERGLAPEGEDVPLFDENYHPQTEVFKLIRNSRKAHFKRIIGVSEDGFVSSMYIVPSDEFGGPRFVSYERGLRIEKRYGGVTTEEIAEARSLLEQAAEAYNVELRFHQ